MAGTAELAIVLKGKDQASAALRGVGTGLNNMAGKARMAGMALSAMGGAIMGILGMSIKTFVQMGDEVQKMALRTGFATETLSELRHAAQISGASLETFSLMLIASLSASTRISLSCSCITLEFLIELTCSLVIFRQLAITVFFWPRKILRLI